MNGPPGPQYLQEIREHYSRLQGFLAQLIVPGWHVLIVLTTEASQVEITAIYLGQFDQSGEPIKGIFIYFVWSNQELPELQVTTNDIGTQVIHLGKVHFNPGPFSLPVILEKQSFIIVIIIAAPRSERFI